MNSEAKIIVGTEDEEKLIRRAKSLAKKLEKMSPEKREEFINKLNKEIELVIEVDGSQHKNEIQLNRDIRKDKLLTNAGIKVLRLSTTTIECKEKIIEKLKS
jgi:hypothetical protein